MLTGELGIRLMLLVGDTVPLPASSELVSALEQVQVTSDAAGGDGFQLTFRLARGLVDYPLVLSGAVDPFKRVIVGVMMGAVPQVLIDGIITHQQLTPGDRPGDSTLTVSGRDVSVMMDLEEVNEEYPNQPDFVIATTIIGRYAQYGLIPKPTPTADVPIQLQRVPRQAETDLAFLKRMAERNGYVFYVEPVTFGVNTAYWGPQTRVAPPQPALTVGMGSADNLNGIHFSQDGMAPVSASGAFVEPLSRTPIPIPRLPPIKLPPLAARPVMPRRTRIARSSGQESPARAALSVLSASTNAPDPVTAEGEVNAARYGHVLRARGIVGVRGVGLAYGGMYYVRRVTHTLRPAAGSYTQSFSLSREGTVSLLPAVVP
ncbi:MAG TPA: hypothetical protein VF665_19235 [Longimicrobium sp.]|uniref:phage late control D family protein n=1 Tax=Longimicrobium sp. TaxID=2029185 RepID=UPI002ED89CBA